MTPLGIERVGAVTAVGLNAAQSMGSVFAGLSRPRELPIRDPDGGRLRVHAAPLATALGSGAARLLALATSAFEECAAGDEEPLPLILCCPPEDAFAYDAAALVRGMGSKAIDVGRVQVVTGGHAAIGRALVAADAALRDHPACYVGAVDSLLDIGRLQRLMRARRILSTATPDGFVPGEGAAFLRVSRLPWKSSVEIAGVAAEEEEATRDSGRVTGRAQSRAVRSALAAGGASVNDVGLLVADLTGERHRFYEAALAQARLRPKTLRRVTLGLSLGEVGCALGALSLVYLATALSRGWEGTARGSAMYLGADDGAPRTAVLVRRAHRGG